MAVTLVRSMRAMSAIPLLLSNGCGQVDITLRVSRIRFSLWVSSGFLRSRVRLLFTRRCTKGEDNFRLFNIGLLQLLSDIQIVFTGSHIVLNQLQRGPLQVSDQGATLAFEGNHAQSLLVSADAMRFRFLHHILVQRAPQVVVEAHGFTVPELIEPQR